MEHNEDYRASELYGLLYSTFPRLRRIEDCLARADPALISELIRNEPESVFVLDYYFRLFAGDIGARIINAPELDMDSLAELFNCRAVQFFSDNQESDQPDFSHNARNDSYWSRLNDDRRLALFRQLPEGDEHAFGAGLLLRDMGPAVLDRLTREREGRIVALFRDEGLTSLFPVNPDLYDCVYRAAVRLGDAVVLERMDRHLGATVGVRLARVYSAELRESLDDEGRVPMDYLLHLAQNLPPDSLERILDNLRGEGLIEGASMDELLRLNREILPDAASLSSG